MQMAGSGLLPGHMVLIQALSFYSESKAWEGWRGGERGIFHPAPLPWGFCGHLLTDSRYSMTLVGPQLEVVEIQVPAGLGDPCWRP